VDIGLSKLPDIKNKTFGTMSAEDLLVWDEYRDW
jgi:hypothetical protein